MTVSEDFLLTLAEIAIALIGFSGVVTILGHRNERRWTPEEVLQLRSQVEPSAVALFGAFIPSTVGIMISDEYLLWRVSNGLLAVLFAYATIAYFFRTRGVTTLTSQKVMSTIAVVVLFGILASAFGIVEYHQFIFVIGILLAIAVGVHNFALLLFRRDEAT